MNTNESTVPDWENPGVYSINQRIAHVPLRSFKTAEAALRYFERGPRKGKGSGVRGGVTSLNGSNWNFKLYDRPEMVPRDFPSQTFDTSSWGKVRLDHLLDIS